MHLRHDPSQRGCMMYIRHRVRRSGEYAKPVARGRLDPERLGLLLLLFSFRRRVAIVFQGPPSNDLRGRKSYLATNPLFQPVPPPSLVKRRDRYRKRGEFERIFPRIRGGKRKGKLECNRDNQSGAVSIVLKRIRNRRRGSIRRDRSTVAPC